MLQEAVTQSAVLAEYRASTPLIEACRREAEAEGLRAFPITGDMMRPTVDRGDLLVVAPIGRFDGDGIYVLDGIDGPYVRRVHATGPTLHLVADNPRYEPDTLSRERFDALVVARAVFKVNVLDRGYHRQGRVS